MVQLGNFHIGRYDTAEQPTISSGEAYTLWDNLVARYDWDDTLEVFYNYAYDAELKRVIEHMIKLLKEQSKILEKELALYQIPLPHRPREIVNFQADSRTVEDEFIFRRLFSGLQDFLTICAEALRHCVVNDKLRDLFIRLLFEKMEEFDFLCEFGRQKDWLKVPPLMPIK